MDLHVRQVFFTADGWPVVSPQRYAGVSRREFNASDLAGEWEILRVIEPRAERELEAGQILWGEGDLRDGEWNDWLFDAGSQTLCLTVGGEKISGLVVHAGHDWEREADTVLFTGLDSTGRSVWGKRVK